ncbi:MAG: hypothetical protein LH647_23520 [Leptolyngbyaceae cyanobacterium CAN_BIN12]|nr:hypothetical protein [Leptolyngbyaceae cyanobacterium CAN_BIN12]
MIKELKVYLYWLAWVLSLAIAHPAIANPIAKQSPDYPMITQALTKPIYCYKLQRSLAALPILNNLVVML